MLAWFPPPGAKLTVPLSDSHSLVRLLGGGQTANDTHTKDGHGDVVLRDGSGALSTRWDVVWSRLDTWANNSLQLPILVLDNVPFAFCAPGKCEASGGGYGMNYGPDNVTEYADWIETLLHAMVSRYGKERVSSFWFRIGTEPNTRPAHWADTNEKYVAEYVAVATVIARVLPDAKVGMANMGLDGSATGFDDEVMPMVRGIAASGAPVDFLAMSCYGRGYPHCETQLPPGNHADCRYSVTTAALCATRLEQMRAVSPRWASVPAQVMEYGLQQNELHLVDDDPGAFGAAWMLATSVAHATGARVERGFHWGLGFDGFAHDDGACSSAVSATPCHLYKGTAWVQAQAGHLFGDDEAVVLEATRPGSNKSSTQGTSADGLGGWSPGGHQLRLLITAFSPYKTDADEVQVRVAFSASAHWSSGGLGSRSLQMRTSTLNSTTASYNVLYREAKEKGWLVNSTDPNVYRLSHMLTREGKTALVEQRGAAYLAMQRELFAASGWRDADSAVKCDDAGSCLLSLRAAPPSVVAVWVRLAPSESFV